MDDGKTHLWKRELNDFRRGLSGAFLFGVPLLYTMEVWWKGNYTSPARMLAALGITYTSLLILMATAGFRRHQKHDWSRMMSDSVEALAIALLSAAAGLFVVGVLSFGLSVEAALGRITLEAIPFGIGVGISNLLVGEEKDANSGSRSGPQPFGDGQSEAKGLMRDTFADAGATLLGATIIAFSIAPTDEVILIASRLTTPQLLILAGASLAISYVIVFESSFASQSKRLEQQGVFQHPFSETVASYLISLLAAALMLWIFQLIGSDTPYSTWLHYTIVLGFPATIGGAAGRLAV